MRILSGVLAVLLLSAAASAADVENPFRLAKEGDWVSYKMTTALKAMPQNQEMEMKQTVIKKTDTEVTLEMAMKINGQDMKQTRVIKLDEKYDPLQSTADAQVKETGSGDEKVTVGDKSYDTKWKTVEVTAKGMTSKAKIWTASSVQLGGLVKMVTDLPNDMGTSTMELTGSGSK